MKYIKQKEKMVLLCFLISYCNKEKMMIKQRFSCDILISYCSYTFSIGVSHGKHRSQPENGREAANQDSYLQQK